VDGTPLVTASPAAANPAPAPAPRAPLAVPAPTGSGQNRTLVIVAAAAVALLAVVGIGYSLLRTPSPKTSTEQRAANPAGGQDGATNSTGNASRGESAGDASRGRDDAGRTEATDDRRTTEVAQADSEAGRAADQRDEARSQAPVRRCTRAACFEIFSARLSPATARPGQTVRAIARYTFQHNEGGRRPLQVEQSVQAGIRGSRGESRRVDSGYGPNSFDLTFRVPDRADAGTYPVTLSVRRRTVTESIRLQLVVAR
jgi:hypothetical protein